MTFFARDATYWNNKVKNFLHDPPDKPLRIPGHEKRSNLLLDALGISATIHAEDYRDEDRIAAGMDRVALPGYSPEKRKNGAIDFLEHPYLTHPLGNDPALRIELPEDTLKSERENLIGEISLAMQRLLREDLGSTTDGRGLSEKAGLKGEEESFAPVRFHYLHFLFKKRLAEENLGNLGQLWPRLPADTRIPDHSIWQHNSLVSALASCRELAPEKGAGIMVFSLGPVQDFIARARKLRDFWSGSLLLSWLAFEGIKVVIAELGADHVLYPSLHDQPLIEGLLADLGMDELLDRKPEAAAAGSGVASFPNKFVFLVPRGWEDELAEKIARAINHSWLELGRETLELIWRKIGRRTDFVDRLFRKQMESYWEFRWAAAPLFGKNDRDIISQLLHKNAWERAFKLLEETENLFPLIADGKGTLYSVSHALAQAALAAGKQTRTNRHPPEEGIKCDMFGEYEIIHYPYTIPGDHNPPPSRDPFWVELRQSWDTPTDFRKTERLCAIGLVKRLAYRVCQQIKGHPLAKMFEKSGNFPATTEMALSNWYRTLQRQARLDEHLANELAQLLKESGQPEALPLLAQAWHEEFEPRSVERLGPEIAVTDDRSQKIARRIFGNPRYRIQDYDKYYALLLMDGDHLGKLVNGETLGATWGSVIAPELTRRLSGDFDSRHKGFWQRLHAEKRLVAPSTHAAISQALGDFSLFTVPAVIAKHGGKLIYAGGDDVCALLPTASAIDAAREIAAYYQAGFIARERNGENRILENSWAPAAGPLAIHPGRGPGISISAGILIAHHKKPLAGVVRRGHELLELAKNQGGRSALALELDKRSGGGRVMLERWQTLPDDALGLPDEERQVTIWEHFLRVADSLANYEDSSLSSSLAYRLETFLPGLAALEQKDAALIPTFIDQQLKRSQKDWQEAERLRTARSIASLITRRDASGKLPLESLIVAKFIGLCRRRIRKET